MLTLFCCARLFERCGFYMMRAILVIHFFKVLGNESSALYYTGLLLGSFYISPLIVGLLVRTARSEIRSVYLGCVMLSSGYFLLAMGALVAPAILFVIGAGLYSTNIRSVFSRSLAPDRRSLASEFNWLYFATNLGSFVAPFLVIALGSDARYVFVVAGVLAILCAFTFALAISRNPHTISTAGITPPLPSIVEIESMACNPSAPPEIVKQPVQSNIYIVLVVTALSFIFWLGFEQKSGKLNLFAQEEMAPAFIFGLQMPPSLLLSVNPLLVVLLTPAFAMIWKHLGKKGHDPHALLKMGSGIIFLGIGFLILEIGVNIANGGKVEAAWFVALYVCHTIGELLIEPIGNDFVLLNSPEGRRAFFLAVWECTSGLALYSAPFFAVFLGDLIWVMLGIVAILGGVGLIAFARPVARRLL
jgi:POT family proton-dependent oligopeptide transporter